MTTDAKAEPLLLESDPVNNDLLYTVRCAARWFEPQRVGMIGYVVYPLPEPGVVLSVIARCPGHKQPDAPDAPCGKLLYTRHTFVPGIAVTAQAVRAEMMRQSAVLRAWICADPPHAARSRPREFHA